MSLSGLDSATKPIPTETIALHSIEDLKTHRAALIIQLGQLRAEASLPVLNEIVRIDHDIWRLLTRR